jgi:hypothetical protein
VYSALFCEFGTDLAWHMEALLRERHRDKLFMCLSGETSKGVGDMPRSDRPSRLQRKLRVCASSSSFLTARNRTTPDDSCRKFRFVPYVDDGLKSWLTDKRSGIQSAVIIGLFSYYTKYVNVATSHCCALRSPSFTCIPCPTADKRPSHRFHRRQHPSYCDDAQRRIPAFRR